MFGIMQALAPNILQKTHHSADVVGFDGLTHFKAFRHKLEDLQTLEDHQVVRRNRSDPRHGILPRFCFLKKVEPVYAQIERARKLIWRGKRFGGAGPSEENLEIGRRLISGVTPKNETPKYLREWVSELRC
jgi:hypothetical protein